MTENYYTPNVDGNGFEGVLSYVSTLTDNIFVPAFLLAIWIIMVYNLSKSEWKLSSVIAYSTLTTLILSWVFKLFVSVNEKFIFAQAILLGVCVVWGIIESNNK